MIASDDRSVIVSSLGWVDHDALWVLNAPHNRPETVACNSGAKWLSVRKGSDGHFVVVHHFDAERFELSVRRFETPHQADATVIVTSSGAVFSGDQGLWRYVPRLHAEYLPFAPWQEYVLLTVEADLERVAVQRFAWFDDSYDHGCQGIIGVLEMPGEDFAMVAVQRSSVLVMHDLETGASRGSVALGDRQGNPHMLLRRGELWATDYDTLIVVDTCTWQVARSRHLQDAVQGTAMFVGDFALTADESTCLVARPGSGDIIGLEPQTLAVVGRAMTGQEPLELAALGDDRVVARDWKTGAFLSARVGA
jgi:hypothetical protein